MAGRTEYEAVHNFLTPIAKALDYITKIVPDVSGGYYASTEPHVLMLAKGNPVPLAGQYQLTLSLTHHYQISQGTGDRGPWRVTTRGYQYSFDDASTGHEIISFQWHPDQRNAVQFPHLHIGYGSGVTFGGLIKSHVPTGRISIEAMVRFAINELKVTPRRDDWEETLMTSLAHDDANQTW